MENDRIISWTCLKITFIILPEIHDKKWLYIIGCVSITWSLLYACNIIFVNLDEYLEKKVWSKIEEIWEWEKTQGYLH